MSMRPVSTVPASTATVPARLGKYTITGVLGEGAMGTVYKGFDPVIRRPVAVKAIRAHLFDAAVSNLAASERFRNEAQAAGRLSHPGIVGVYEYGEENGDAFIAMEYVEGTPLGHIMAQPERLSESDMLSLMVQLLDALHYAHEQGVWHRDVKPNNLIVTSTGKLKITDFGIARIESAGLTQITMLLGSPGYIAPERYTGEAPDRRVDIFSCGVLLYHLLTGRSPFPGTEAEVMYKVLHSDPTAPSQTTAAPPRYFDDIVAKALAKRPDDRYATARQFRDVLVKAGVLPVPATMSMAAIETLKPHAEAAAPQAVTPAAMPPSGSERPAQPGVVPGATAARPLRDSEWPAPPRDSEWPAPPRDSERPAPPRDSERPAPPRDSERPAPPSVEPAISLPSHPAGWDTALVAQIESLLAQFIGPIAAVLVRRTAKQSAGVGELLARLAEDALPPEDRKPFLMRTSKLIPAAEAPSAPARARSAATMPTMQLPVLGVVPLLPDTIEKAERVLTREIGPIARVMVKKAAAGAAGRDDFFLALADLAADDVDRERLLGNLSRLA
jgi:serine/threonine protein kinase